MMLATRLNERVRVERPVTTDDGYGGKTVVWNELATVFAEVKPVLGAINEGINGEQRVSHAGYRVVIRLRTDITAAMRFVWGSRVLLIHSLHEHEESLNMLCYEENV